MRYPQIEDVILMGTRGVGTARPDTDWEILIVLDSAYSLQTRLSQDKTVADPMRVKEMHDKLFAWREETGAKMPTPNTGKPDPEAKKKRKKAAKAEED